MTEKQEEAALEIQIEEEEEEEAQAVEKFDATPPPPPALVNESDGVALIRMALERGIDTDQLEKLINLKNREEERQAKQRFDKEFSKLQRKLGPVLRDKQATDPKNNDRVLYAFAPIETIVKAVGPTITKAGFSWRWTYDERDDGKKLATTCHVTGWGHEETTTVVLPVAPGNSFANAVQQVGISQTYGDRYSFKGAFGIVLDDEDDDAISYSAEDVVQYASGLAMIEDSNDGNELIENFRYAYKAVGDDVAGQNLLSIAKNKKKKELGI